MFPRHCGLCVSRSHSAGFQSSVLCVPGPELASVLCPEGPQHGDAALRLPSPCPSVCLPPRLHAPCRCRGSEQGSGVATGSVSQRVYFHVEVRGAGAAGPALRRCPTLRGGREGSCPGACGCTWRGRVFGNERKKGVSDGPRDFGPGQLEAWHPLAELGKTAV